MGRFYKGKYGEKYNAQKEICEEYTEDLREFFLRFFNNPVVKEVFELPTDIDIFDDIAMMDTYGVTIGDIRELLGWIAWRGIVTISPAHPDDPNWPAKYDYLIPDVLDDHQEEGCSFKIRLELSRDHEPYIKFKIEGSHGGLHVLTFNWFERGKTWAMSLRDIEENNYTDMML